MSHFLEVQKYLAQNSLEKLEEEYGIEHTLNNDKTLVILNYSQIRSDIKYNPIVKECRGLCLENNTWLVKARSFFRFFNWSEDVEGQKNFNWEKSVCQEKIDGSLGIVYFHDKIWRFNTRGSFATGSPSSKTGLSYNGSWQQLFEETLGYKLDNAKLHSKLYKDYTYVFELCSKFNQTIIYHKKPKIYLLAICQNYGIGEYQTADVKNIAKILNVDCPKIFSFKDIETTQKFIEESGLKGNEIEGFVFKDINNNRIKLKLPEFQRLHKLSNNGNCCLLKNLVPWIVESHDDLAEALLYLPEVQNKYNEVFPKVEFIKNEAKKLWQDTKNTENQKEFALAVKDTPYSSILFNTRKTGDFTQSWKSMGDYIYERFFSKCSLSNNS